MKKIQGQFSLALICLSFSMTYAYSNILENNKPTEKVNLFVQNYFDSSAKQYSKRQIYLTISLIPPRDLAQLPPCDSEPQLQAFTDKNLALLNVAVRCLTGSKWSIRYMARAMFRLEQNAPPRPFTRQNLINASALPAQASAPSGYLIKKGQQIELIAHAELIEIRASVIAEENGKLGDVIRVRNKRTGKKLDAQVKSAQEVSPLQY
ncbi:flagella basal body P-ring formation protein FlgA [Iodobacter sp. CM08]|uniref:flagella basal body P-ring formation protein FlgA n=1 Tax=Iodobacter sp. CM08 TaxID=3085902 RepID=UPI002982895F|nr:flagella basal body P-ring formation protein FlgA [Iodobacter sp. CM08]MDW5417380.1 flagella basal body P-ring formation protein FlgA [Iodobacter sp. CM08]